MIFDGLKPVYKKEGWRQEGHFTVKLLLALRNATVHF